MSDFEFNKVIRFKPTTEMLKQCHADDVFDLVMKLSHEHKNSKSMHSYINHHSFPHFDIGFNEENQYIDLYLESTHMEQVGDYGCIHQLLLEDFLKYRQLFADYLQVDKDEIKSLCKLEYCWYNCTEPPDYYEEYNYSKLEVSSERLLAIAYNAIVFGQFDEMYDKEKIFKELGCTEEEYNFIMEI